MNIFDNIFITGYTCATFCTIIGYIVGTIGTRHCIQFGRDMERQRCDDMVKAMFSLAVEQIVTAKIDADEGDEEEQREAECHHSL